MPEQAGEAAQAIEAAHRRRISVVTLFPEMFSALTHWGVTGRAFERGSCEMSLVNLRDFAVDRHGTVDDRPYGGGPGMVLKAPVLAQAVSAARQRVERTPGEAVVIAMSPQGEVLTDGLARELSEMPALTVIAGRYEGMDERFIDAYVDREISIGDFVVSGGELPAMVMLDAMIRLMPAVLGHAASAQEDSFADGVLDYPHYTRPEVFEGRAVPPVLMSGDHAAIARWRRAEALRRTLARRPDLLAAVRLDKADEAVLSALREETGL